MTLKISQVWFKEQLEDLHAYIVWNPSFHLVTVPEISIPCSRYIFGEGKASIKRIVVKSTSDSFILSYELHYKLGNWDLKKVPQKERSSSLSPRPPLNTQSCSWVIGRLSLECLQWQEALSFIKWPTPTVYLAELSLAVHQNLQRMLSKNRHFRALPRTYPRAPTQRARINLFSSSSSFFFNTPKAAHPQNHTEHYWFNMLTFSEIKVAI